jgi:hypothetical protein
MFYGSSGFRKYMIKSSHKYLHAITKKKRLVLFYFWVTTIKPVKHHVVPHVNCSSEAEKYKGK